MNQFFRNSFKFCIISNFIFLFVMNRSFGTGNFRGFLSDGRIPLDNNPAEQKIRNFTIGRKNWVMVDTKSGAEASAAMYSIVETAKANNLKMYDYLVYLLTELSKIIHDFSTEVPEKLLTWSCELPDNLYKK